jgi:hypothetical protein
MIGALKVEHCADHEARRSSQKPGADGDRAYPWGAWFNLPLTIFRTKKFLRANDAAPRPQHERTQLAETQNPKQARR